MTPLPAYEKMDLFYLGRELDFLTGKSTQIPFLLQSKQLNTHAALIGMTGSGKTGLGIGLLEEAAIDKIPAIVIDPKGDMGNLLLSFPELEPGDFLPWVSEDEAKRKGVSPAQRAQALARTWEDGLQSWDQDKGRIRRMRAHAEFQVYTPGNTSGTPVSILGSFDAPDKETLANNEVAANLVNAAVSSLLAITGNSADPLKSREHILLSSLLYHYWRKGIDVDLEALISGVVEPPFKKIGVLPLETFYPQTQRMELAMQLNNLLASTVYSSWLSGDSLRIEDFLYTADGKPKISIFSIAHLSEDERMFFVTLLLGKFISWMRKQQGSSRLNCMLYMDEIFGFVPPNGNPPSKKPMLLLLKQARAYGVGVVLATQNPVDLDYKGLANIGTWFVGRLQTKQDQDRVLEGIGRGESGAQRSTLRALMSNMKSRSFFMFSARHDEPVLFESRWVLSYLKGPMTISELSRFTKKQDPVADSASSIRQPKVVESELSSRPPMLPGQIPQYFIPLPFPLESVEFHPRLVGTGKVRIFNQRRGIDIHHDISLKISCSDKDRIIDWAQAEEFGVHFNDLSEVAPENSFFHPLASELVTQKNLRPQEKALSEFLYRTIQLNLHRVRSLKMESTPSESLEAFQFRLAARLAEEKGQAEEKIINSFKTKEHRLKIRLEKAIARVEKEEVDVKARGMDTALSFGVAILGALLGRKKLSTTTATRTARGMRNAGRVMKERGDVQRAEEEVARVEEELVLLSNALQERLEQVANRFTPDKFPVEQVILTPRRADVFNINVAVVWEPEFLDVK